MSETGWTKEKVRNLKISLSIALVIFLLAGIRVIKCRDDRILIFSADRYNAWVLFPTTIHTYSGEIHLRFLTEVSHSDGHISAVFNEKGNIKQNLVIRGNKIENFFLVDINHRGGIFTYANLDTPQPFVIEGVEFKILSFEVGRMTTDSDWIIATDFDEIRLADGTVVKPGSEVPEFVLLYGLDEWELYHTYDQGSYFIATNPAWNEEKYINEFVFEKDWGKMISYEEAVESDYP